MDFVTFELAKKLKEKGCPQDAFIGYDEFGTLCIGDEHSIVCVSPTISQVLKWLREEMKIHIVCPFYKDKGFYYYVQRIGNAARIVSSFDDSDDCFDTYEHAALAGIEYTLDNLI